ncbi:MAG: ATP-binding protein [Gemmatimonadota bacterium]|nr:ATP-binding protein [Gemmatimonadota bacterium]
MEDLEQALAEARARLRASARMAALGKLTASVAHEIRNPLNFIKNFSVVSADLVSELRTTLESVELPGAQRDQTVELLDQLERAADRIVEHVGRADGIVSAMTLRARSEEGEPEPVDLDALLAHSCDLSHGGLHDEQGGRRVEVIRELAGDLPTLRLDPQAMSRVFINLLNNAFEAVQERARREGPGYAPRIRAATRRTGDAVVVEVEDNGVGLEDGAAERLFEPFFTTKPPGRGTGLGLSVSREIVEEAGGTIEVASEPGEGTTVRVRLPAAAEVRTPRPERERAGRPEREPARSPEREPARSPDREAGG